MNQIAESPEIFYCIDDNSDFNSSNSSILSSDEEGESFQVFNPTKKYSQAQLDKLNNRFVGYENTYLNATYEKSNWIKATFDKKTKRFANPPKDLDELINLFKRRFGVLRAVCEMGQKPIIHYKPSNNLAYKQVETSRDLLTAFNLSSNDSPFKKGKTLHVLITF